MNRAERAAQAFLSDYNCAQAVTLAFADLMDVEEATAVRMASPFGGGMGRMREVCGAVSGMLLVLGDLYGYEKAEDTAGKKRLYRDIQALAEEFRGRIGSIVCREILKNPPSDPNPTPRTAEFYASRPCVRMVMTAAELLEDFIEKHPLENR